MSYIVGNWRAGMQRVSQTIDQTFGETLTLIQCEKHPNTQARPTGIEVTLLGVFSWRAELAFQNSNPLPNAGRGGLVSTRKPIVSFSRAELPWVLNTGDQIMRCCDGNLFEITAVEPDGVSRTTCTLVQLGIPTQ